MNVAQSIHFLWLKKVLLTGWVEPQILLSQGSGGVKVSVGRAGSFLGWAGESVSGLSPSFWCFGALVQVPCLIGASP